MALTSIMYDDSSVEITKKSQYLLNSYMLAPYFSNNEKKCKNYNLYESKNMNNQINMGDKASIESLLRNQHVGINESNDELNQEFKNRNQMLDEYFKKINKDTNCNDESCNCSYDNEKSCKCWNSNDKVFGLAPLTQETKSINRGKYSLDKHIIPYMHINSQKALAELPVNLGFYNKKNMFLNKPTNTREVGRNSKKSFKIYGWNHPRFKKVIPSWMQAP
tara:strand:- start:860 stop:1519 length:660 start_codon:yes stop_codon:yes gene_type:complete